MFNALIEFGTKLKYNQTIFDIDDIIIDYSNHSINMLDWGVRFKDEFKTTNDIINFVGLENILIIKEYCGENMNSPVKCYICETYNKPDQMKRLITNDYKIRISKYEFGEYLKTIQSL
jgi:hypothetical protein